MKMFLVAILLVSLAGAEVLPGTAHRSDCVEFDEWIRDCGVYNAFTKIVYRNGGCHYVVYYDENYNLNDDWREGFSAAVAAGSLSLETTWESSCCIIVYNDQVIAITTEECRFLWDRYVCGYYDEDECLSHYISYSLAIGREETNW